MVAPNDLFLNDDDLEVFPFKKNNNNKNSFDSKRSNALILFRLDYLCKDTFYVFCI